MIWVLLEDVPPLDEQLADGMPARCRSGWKPSARGVARDDSVNLSAWVPSDFSRSSAAMVSASRRRPLVIATRVYSVTSDGRDRGLPPLVSLLFELRRARTHLAAIDLRAELHLGPW